MNNSNKNLIQSIFFPHTVARAQKVKSAGGRFVHYTTAEVAVSILRRKEIWMRNASTMNDYSEIVHGFTCLKSAYKDDTVGKDFQAAIDDCFPGLSDEIAKLFDSWWPVIRQETYIACLSEHAPDGAVAEDQHGRLSMWRAYGGNTGIALVLNGAAMFSESDVLKIYSSPVSYLSTSEFSHHLAGIATRIRENSSVIRDLGYERTKGYLFQLFRFAVLCTKHPGFLEEREWRVVSTPKLDSSIHVQKSVEVVHGIPQLVQKVPLKNHPNDGLVGMEIPELVNRIIIGPCESPMVIKQALVALLSEAGVEEAHKRILISNIPLRSLG